MSGFREERIAAAGCTVRVIRGGSGAPIVYLHGAGGLTGPAPFMEKLAARHEFLAPEHPGFGAGEDPPWLDNIHDEAYFYLCLLDRLGFEKVHLVGMSIGGWIAAEIAVRSTRRLASLTLCGAAGIQVKGVPKGDPFMWSPEELWRNGLHDQALAAKMAALPASPEQMQLALRNRRTFALLAWQPRLFDPNLHKWLHRIDVPTHIVWADDDKILPVVYAAEWQKLIPGSTVTVLPSCGHLMHVEQPAQFAAAVLRFIEGART